MMLYRRMPAVVAALTIATLALPALATEKAEIERVFSAAREESRVMDHLDHLSNRIGPRLTGSDGLQTACEWARGRFASFGIDNARLEKWGEFPVGFDRGPWSGRMVEPTVKPLTFATNAWTAGTKGIVRGPAVLAPEDDAQLAAIKGKLAGAYVLTPNALPVRGGRGRELADFRKRRDAAYAEAGAAGVIRSSRAELALTGGQYQISWDKLPEVPAITLVKSQFDEALDGLKAGKPVAFEFDIRNHFKQGPIPLCNVIADIPGTDLADEYVIVGGHIDTWDGATGTTDNGTGCATTLEAARILMKSGVKPRRTIRFMLWSGEEQGLLGSKAYVKAHPELMPRISAVLVHDGGTNYLSGIGGTKAMKADIDLAFAPVVGIDKDMPFAIREVPGLRGGGSDHASFLAAGVPGFFWRQSGKAVYNTTHHTQHDTFDRAVPEYQKHSALVVALGALGIADLDHLLSREAMIPPGGMNRRNTGMQFEGMKVTELTEGGVAEQGGIEAGDVIVQVDGKKVTTREELMEAIQSAPAMTEVVVTRDGKEVAIKLTFPAPTAP